jgi:hypothetical protein
MEEIKELLEKYYEGTTSSHEEQVLINYFSKGSVPSELKIHQKEFEAIKMLQGKTLTTQHLPNFIEPRQIKVSKNYWNTFFKIAASIAFLLIGYVSGNTFSSETERIAKLEEDLNRFKENTAMLLLEQSLANKRILGLNHIDKIEKPSAEMIESLLDVLNSDPNDNIRLAAIPHLARYAKSEAVKEGLISSFNNQESPFIQLELLSVYTNIASNNDLKKFKKNIDHENLNKIVIERLNTL